MLDIKKTISNLRDTGFNPYPTPPRIRIPNAKEALQECIRHYVGERAQWLPCYDEVADWLTDNKGRGLLCLGPCGLGKTLICCNVLPVLFYHYYKKIVSVYNAVDINTKIDSISRQRIVCLDDIGTEPDFINYGERHVAFSEIVDAAEKRGNLLVITTNLRTTSTDTDKSSIEARYEQRTLDRLRAITKVVLFKGRSLRG